MDNKGKPKTTQVWLALNAKFLKLLFIHDE
jgi:hypothetical protein